MFLNFICITVLISPAFCDTYSTEKNSVEKEYLIDSPISTVKTINVAPFKTQRLNLVWEQAVKKPSKFYPKLDRIYADLKLQDKEELNWRAEKEKDLDKDDLKEALIQKNFKAILIIYDLMDEYLALPESVLKSAEQEFTFPQYVDKNAVFKDRKLNELWLEAEKQGFSEEELKALKEEFQRQQNLIAWYDHFDMVLFISKRLSEDKLGGEEIDHTETLLQGEKGDKYWNSENPQDILKDKRAAIETGYDYLKSRIMPKRKTMEFEEPQVKSLWERAKNASFTPEQLDSLRNALYQFEQTVKKLKSLTSEMDNANVADEDVKKWEEKLKEYSNKVDEMYKDISHRILHRHLEL